MGLTDSLTASFNHFSARTTSFLHSAGRTQLLITAACIATGIPLISYIRADYKSWHSLGQGGAPRNPLGYFMIKCLGAIYGSRDLHSTGVYTSIAADNDYEATSFLDGPLPARAGQRPNVSRWVAPVRQLSQGSSPETKAVSFNTCTYMMYHAACPDPSQALESTILALATQSTPAPPLFAAASSQIEGATHPANALHTLPGASHPRRVASPRGPSEAYHFHPSDGSAHAILSAADAGTLLDAGWGERHPLSGAGKGGIPVNYVMVYAARDEGEVRVHERVALAAVGYAVGRRIGGHGVDGEGVEEVEAEDQVLAEEVEVLAEEEAPVRSLEDSEEVVLFS